MNCYSAPLALLVLSLVLTGARSLHAQNGLQFRDWKASLVEGPPSQPQTDCTALVSLTRYDFSIETAEVVTRTADVPEYCKLSGQILPEVRFELSLPAQWNGRFYMFGNGGYAGESIGAPGRGKTRDNAVKRGFAVAQTNTGHDAVNQELGSFAVERQKLLDYAWRAVHLTTVTSKSIINNYYGQSPAKFYFDGCSTGGRQGLMSAQRFPEDFDGILVGAPVLDFTGTMTGFVWNAQALAEGPLTTQKLNLVGERVYKQCDGLDGLVDGLITDPRNCGFDPAKDLPICTNDQETDCINPAELHTLQAIYGGAKSQGKQVFWGQPVGAEIDRPIKNQIGSGWDRWILPTEGRSIGATFAESFFRYLVFRKPDPNYELKSFNFESDLGRLNSISRILDATNPDLSRFKERGGKILMYFGWADTALNPLMGIDYYEKVHARFASETSEFFRLFMIPGMAHCRGGVGTDEFDAFTPLVEWVEKGVAPKQILASQTQGDKVVRTRPLCTYPMVATYGGTGSPDDAKNFACVQP